MVKLVDMPDLGSGAARRVGSSPIIRTKKRKLFTNNSLCFFLFLELPNHRSTVLKPLVFLWCYVVEKISFRVVIVFFYFFVHVPTVSTHEYKSPITWHFF